MFDLIATEKDILLLFLEGYVIVVSNLSFKFYVMTMINEWFNFVIRH